MIAFTQAACSASAFSHFESRAFRQADDVSPFGPNDGDSPTRTWGVIIDELLQIRNLKDDWDGEGSEAPHPALVDGAITLAQYLQARGLTAPERAHVGVNGTIYFEWHTVLGYREIEVTSPVEAECRTVRKGSNEAEVVILSRRS